MVASRIKLSYIAPQKRIRCEFTKADADAHSLPPEDLFDRAKAKLDSEKAGGEISFYRIFKSRLVGMWQVLRESSEPDDTRVGVTIASGAPAMPGLIVSKPRSDHEIGRISIEASQEETAQWKPYFLKLTVGYQLRKIGITAPPNSAQVTRIWYRALSSIPVVDLPLVPMPTENRNRKHPSYEIIEEESNRDITLVVYDVNGIAKPDVWEQLKNEIWQIIDARTINGVGSYQFLYDDLVRALRSAERGPEHYGFDMPMVLLAAIDSRYYREASRILETGEPMQSLGRQISTGENFPGQRSPMAKSASNDRRPGQSSEQKKANGPLVAVEVSPDRMCATLVGFGPLGDVPQPSKLAIPWIKEQVEKLGFSSVATSTCLDAMAQKLAAPDGNRSLIGMAIARGQLATSGRSPFLKRVDSRGIPEQGSRSEVVDLRAAQRSSFVNAGEKIAELAFAEPSIPGFDIFGTVLAPSLPGGCDISVGPGVRQGPSGQFYALWDGEPKIEGLTLSVAKGLLHKGDVNLASGNIKFEGPVEISGSIEAGAVVDVLGDLTVGGSIGKATVYCTGNITVAGGVNTGPGGIVRCGGNLSCFFIDNSRLAVGADIICHGGITNSDVSCAGSVSAPNIVGREFHVGGGIQCTTLGKEGGNPTLISLGGDRKGQQRLRILTSRIDRLTVSQAEVRKKIRLLGEKSAQQKTGKHLSAEQALLVKSQRLGTIIDRCREKLNTAQTRLQQNENGTVKVEGVLAAGTIISIGKHRIRVAASVSEVEVKFRPGAGVVVSPLVEDEAEDAENSKAAS